MNKFLAALLPAAALSLSWTAMPAQATVILEGSDAIGFHCSFGSGPACTYRDQVWTAIGGAKPIAVIGTTTSGAAVVSGVAHTVVAFADLSLASATLSDYSAIYFIGAGGCCSSNSGAVAGRGAELLAYSATHTVEIGNYDGNAGWDFLTGGSGNDAFVAGVSGALTGPSCTDGESITPIGTANGFSQPPAISCWTHQAYGLTHFNALGFTLNFFDADPAFAATNPGYGGFSSLLSSGVTLSFVPEPASWALMLVGFGGLGLVLRRKQAALAA